MVEYLPLVVLALLATIFAVASFSLNRLLAPHRPSAAKEAPYECGIVPHDKTAVHFPIRFYLVAMVFIIFDIEIIFLYPWATQMQDMGIFGLVEMGIFTGVVFILLAYLISTSALNWGPGIGREKSKDDAMSTIFRSPNTPNQQIPSPGVVDENVGLEKS